MINLFIFLSTVLMSTLVFAETSEEDLLEAPPEVVAADSMMLKTAQNRKCDFTINCQSQDVGYAFEYKSLGDDCNEMNPGQMVLMTAQKRIPLDIKGLTLKPVEDLGPSAKVCEIKGQKYPSTWIGDSKIALFTRIDGRPSYDKLGVLIIDLKKNKVVRQVKDIGDIKTTYFALLPTEKGFKTRLIKDFLKNVSCDCDAAFVEDWKEVQFVSEEIKSKWLKPKSN